jgi:hypothetical protein
MKFAEVCPLVPVALGAESFKLHGASDARQSYFIFFL